MNEPTVLARGSEILLRDTLPDDVDAYLHWQTNGEWRYYDAPWEGVLESMSESQQEAYRHRFKRAVETPLPALRARATISLPDYTPIGWVNRYANDRFPSVWYVGIDICEDNLLNKGLGTQALGEWVNYLFRHSEIHKIEIHSWSINPRMLHVAEKLEFRHEGTERELLQWQGEWIDRVRYGMLREEWEQTVRLY